MFRGDFILQMFKTFYLLSILFLKNDISRADEQEPLFLTPLLEKNNYIKAQELARVNPDIGNTTSYAGFLTVNKECDSHLFFWFFPSQTVKWESAPVVLWLQGGPGQSSLLGLFEELGPFESYEEGLKARKYSWNEKNNVIFIEQPAGVGYSFTGKDCYVDTMELVGEDLYEAIIQFFNLFPTLQKNRFIIAGESFGGHYVPTIGHTIHKYNPTAKIKINLSVMMIGNGWTDPPLQIDYADYLYQIGMIDETVKDTYKEYQDEFVEEIKFDSSQAIYFWDYILDGLEKEMGTVDLYNYLPHKKRKTQNWDNFIQTPNIRKALHVGDRPYQSSSIIRNSLNLEIARSVKPWVEELLNFYPIIFYNGQLDIICGYPMTTNFLQSLSWSAQNLYLNATRSKWCVGKEQAGYFKGEHHLYDVLVRGAGHMVPADQPHWAYELVNSVTSGTPDNPLHALKTCD